MARHEADREDLIAEATALVPRMELGVPEEFQPVVAGIRNGGLSLYFGGDPVYHFDDQHRLRRAFVDGCLFRTQGTTLARLTRVRTESATELIRHDLSPEELEDFRQRMLQRLGNLAARLERSECRVLRQVPEDSDAVAQLALQLRGIRDSAPELAPAIRGRR